MSKLPRLPDRLASRILWGMALGLAAGAALRLAGGLHPAIAGTGRWLSTELLDPVGQVFLRLLCFVVVPLVFASLALGVAQLGQLRRLGPLAGRTFALFAVNMAVGVALGLVIMNVVQPGRHLAPGTQAHLVEKFSGDARETQAKAAIEPRITLAQLVEMFMPRNLLRAVVDFQILPLIVFAVLVGAAATILRPTYRQRLQEALEIVAELMTGIVHFAMRMAPLAVGALMCSLVLRVGLDVLQSLLLFVLCTLGGMAVHLFGSLSLLLKLLSRRSPRDFFRATRTILVTAFSTSSSNATLPTAIQVTREELGVSASTAGFVLPLGATMNMSGTALYEGCVVLFTAQVYGIPLTLGSQITLLCLTVLSAVAVAGIPGASLPLIVGLLATFGIPPDGIALILGVDRVLDMARTTLNVAADVATACIVDERIGPVGQAAAESSSA